MANPKSTDHQPDDAETLDQERDLPAKDEKAEEAGDRQADQERGIFSALVGDGKSLADPSGD